VDFGRAASMRRFVEDAAAGSGSDDEPDSKGQDHYDLEDAFFDNSEDVSDEEDMHAHYDAQHLQLELAPPDGGGFPRMRAHHQTAARRMELSMSTSPPKGAVLNRCLPLLCASRSAQRD
jgi:hypothetical protein